MPRDASGNYTLPVGNPVVDGTIIETTWANPTLNDIALQLNNVLTRDGLLGPILPLKFVDGTALLPGISFNSDPNTGIYLAAPDVMGFTTGGVTGFGLSTTEANFGVTPKYGGAISGATDLTNKTYVDAAIAAAVGAIGGPYLPLTGGTLSGPGHLAVGGNLGVSGTLTGIGVNLGGILNLTYANPHIDMTDSVAGGSYAIQTAGTSWRLYDLVAGAERFTMNNVGVGAFKGSLSCVGDFYSSVNVQAGFGGGNGATVVTAGTASATGFIQFIAANGIRQGYIGFSSVVAGADGGTIPFIMATAAFNGAITAAGDITAFSDDTVKTNWKDMDQWFVEDLAKVKAGVYDRTDMSLRQVGVSAQSLRHVMPEAVREAQDGSLSVNYGHAALVACVALAREVVRLKDFAHDHPNRAN